MKKTKKTKPRPKLSFLHEEIPKELKEVIQFSKMAEIGRISASIAHEINNPLMVAQGFAENIELLLDSPDFSREELRMQVLEIIKACQRMAKVVQKMNRMSRKQDLRMRVVDLAEVALNAVEFVKSQLDENSVKLDFKFDKPLPVNCDSVQIEQIILNILSNAIHALRDRKGSKTIRISFEEVGEWQQLKIWNNGGLIPKAVQEQLMNPFFTTKVEGEGMGLGLAVSKAIMHVHGADLSFQSEKKIGGTQFQLSFPRPKEISWTPGTSAKRGDIIIVDRAADFRRTLTEKFRLLGFQVADYPDFASAQEAWRTPRGIAAALVDIVPGRRECLDFVRQLRQKLGPTGLIFAMSNFPSARDLKGELQAVGATNYLEKPIDSENFSFILKLLDSAVLDAADKESA
jgi:CheY-like chemotaxis protein/two-component sensor histidine kinase